MALKLITPPTITPVTLDEAKAHLRVDTPDEDALITLLIQAATDHVDGPNAFLGRALIDQTWELVIDAFPPAPGSSELLNQIKIPIPPLIEVVSITYDDPAGMPIVYDPINYTVDTVSEPGWIVPASSWPTTFDGINAVRIRFRAGYVDTVLSTGTVPADIKGAILLYIGALYANREEVGTEGRVPVELPWGADRLLRRRRIDLSMA